MIRNRLVELIEPSLTPPDYWRDQPDYADMSDEQRIAERMAQPKQELAALVVDLERQLEAKA